jgi:putative ABC transport system permease protein
VNALYLAWAHMRWHWGRTAVLVGAVALVLAVPAAVQGLLDASERRMVARAEATPIVVGARGSRLDLTMSALYFSDDQPDPVSMAAADAVWDSGLATAIPLHVRFTAQDAPIVGTTLDYFDFRALRVGEGRQIALLGEAVLGARVAARLGLGPGDSIVSAPATLFDLAGVYPLRMSIVGVLAPANSPDDAAVFVDVKTAWAIAGIGHGHDDVLPAEGNPEKVAEAAASLVQYQEITAKNLDSFHFHGDPAGYPLTAIVAVPNDARSSTILRGRYLDPEAAEQIVVPADVVDGLLEQVFRIRRTLDAAVALVGLAAAAAVALAAFLSLQLRRGEMVTAFRMGCRRGAIARMVTAEVVMVFCLAGGAAVVIFLLAERFADPAAAWLLTLT